MYHRRYKELYSDNREKDYGEAERYYERAAFMFPSSGNPQNQVKITSSSQKPLQTSFLKVVNLRCFRITSIMMCALQLAVLATYMEAECVAVYHYCRSILIRQPFAAGYDNLHLLFEKNSRAYAQLRSGGHVQMVSMMASVGGGAAGAEKAKRVAAAKVRIFLIQFVRLHGILFNWTRQTQLALAELMEIDQYSQLNREAGEVEIRTSRAASHRPRQTLPRVDVESFTSLMHSLLEEFDQLILQSSFGDQLLVRLLVVSIFSVHHSAAATTINSAGSSESDGAGVGAGAGGAGAGGAYVGSGVAPVVLPSPLQIIEASAQTHSHTVGESLALMFSFGLINKYVTLILLICISRPIHSVSTYSHPDTQSKAYLLPSSFPLFKCYQTRKS